LGFEKWRKYAQAEEYSRHARSPQSVEKFGTEDWAGEGEWSAVRKAQDELMMTVRKSVYGSMQADTKAGAGLQ